MVELWQCPSQLDAALPQINSLNSRLCWAGSLVALGWPWNVASLTRLLYRCALLILSMLELRWVGLLKKLQSIVTCLMSANSSGFIVIAKQEVRWCSKESRVFAAVTQSHPSWFEDKGLYAHIVCNLLLLLTCSWSSISFAFVLSSKSRLALVPACHLYEEAMVQWGCWTNSSFLRIVTLHNVDLTGKNI